ncbi:Atpaf2 [Symbiodinium sp. KB8]|nr:Atpaf2 [Symbiodinium sp. KB8]
MAALSLTRRALARARACTLQRGALAPGTDVVQVAARSFSLADYGSMEAPLDATAKGWQGIKRFYDHVGVRGVADDGTISPEGTDAAAWQVLVQGRVLRTNALNDLLLPTKELALAIAMEFGAQKGTIVSATTPLYNLACTAIDSYAKDDLRMAAAAPAVDAVLAKTGQTDLTVSGVADPVLPATEMVDVDRVASTLIKTADFGEDPNRPEIRYATRMPGQASTMSSMGGSGGETARLREMLKDYLETDSICYRVSLETGDPDEALLRRRQDKYYDPLIDWFKNAFGVTLGWTTGLQNVQHSTAAYELCEDIIDSGDHFLRAAVHQALGTTKSTAITLALLFRHISAEQAFNASRVEEEYQIEVNGFVEDGHDTARVSARIQLGAVANLLWLSPASRPPQPPQGLGPEAVQADMEKRLQRVAARRARDAVQGMLEAEERARRRAAVEGGTSPSPASAPLSAEAKEAKELKWMEEELVALQQQTNRMAAGAGMDLPYPEAGVGDAAAAAAAAESSGKSG